MKTFRLKIKLTDEQIEKLKPIFDEAREDFLRGNPGAINAQILNSESEDGLQKDEIYVQGAYIEKSWALKIFDVIEDWRNKRRHTDK